LENDIRQGAHAGGNGVVGCDEQEVDRDEVDRDEVDRDEVDRDEDTGGAAGEFEEEHDHGGGVEELNGENVVCCGGEEGEVLLEDLGTRRGLEEERDGEERNDLA
jgi:hypothetical protein